MFVFALQHSPVTGTAHAEALALEDFDWDGYWDFGSGDQPLIDLPDGPVDEVEERYTPLHQLPTRHATDVFDEGKPWCRGAGRKARERK